jgi:hypothetical protein
MNSTGYAISPANGGDAVVYNLNGRIAKNCQLLACDGLNVVHSLASAHYNIANVSSDNIHPGDAGHQQIADAFNRSIIGLVSARDREGAQMAGRQRIMRRGSLPHLWVVDTVADQIGYGVFSPAYFMDLRPPGISATNLHFSSTGNDDGAYLNVWQAGAVAIGIGAAYNGSAWTAKVAAPLALQGFNGSWTFFADTAQTIGSSYSPTSLATISASGLALIGSGGIVAGGAAFNGHAWINGGGGVQVQGQLSSPSGTGGEFEYNGGTVYVSAVNRGSGSQIPLQCRGSTVTLVTSGTTNLTCNGTNVVLSIPPKFSGANTTGSGSAALGSNSPATTNTSPYTWIQAVSADGSTVYVPAWK